MVTLKHSSSRNQWSHDWRRRGGKLRTGDPRRPVRDARWFDAEHVLGGLDLSWRGRFFGVRAYVLWSEEWLSGSVAPPRNLLERGGVTIEPSFHWELGWVALQRVSLVARYSYAYEEHLDLSIYRLQQLGLALEIEFGAGLSLRFAYLANEESHHAPRLDDDIWSGSLVARF